jgi:hypothetical protein
MVSPPTLPPSPDFRRREDAVAGQVGVTSRSGTARELMVYESGRKEAKSRPKRTRIILPPARGGKWVQRTTRQCLHGFSALCGYNGRYNARTTKRNEDVTRPERRKVECAELHHGSRDGDECRRKGLAADVHGGPSLGSKVR